MSLVFGRSWNTKANAGFAIVAVALLLVGGAAALYLQAVNHAAADQRGAREAEQVALRAAAAREVSTVVSLAEGSLFDALGGNLPLRPGALADASERILADLGAHLDAMYPRVGADGFAIGARVLFARAVPVVAEVDLASPYGGRAPVAVPTFVGAEGLVEISATGRYANFTTVTGFGARFPVPTLLPAAMAARMAAESSPAGRVERIAGQLAQRWMWAANHSALDAAVARNLVIMALGVEAAANFGETGNASLDQEIDNITDAWGYFEPADLVGNAIVTPEMIFGPLPHSFNVSGESSPVTVALRTLDCANLNVAITVAYFDGGEIGGSVWPAVRIGAAGSCAIVVGVTASSGSADVGPIEWPVALSSRAFTTGLPASVLVSSEDLDREMHDIALNGAQGKYAPALQAAGWWNFGNGSIETNASARAIVRAAMETAQASHLPPVEDFYAFEQANAPGRAMAEDANIALDFDEPVEASRALLRVDGADVGYYPVESGALRVWNLPPGLHAIEVEAEANGTRYMGGAEAHAGTWSWNMTVEMAPRYDSEFFHAALARGEALPERAGIVVLAEAGSMVGLPPPTSLANVQQAADYAGEALARLQALSLGSLGDAAAAHRAADARDFLKVMLGLLRAADTANKELRDDSAPIGGLAGSVASLTISASPAAFLQVTIQSVAVAHAVVADNAKALTVEVGAGGSASFSVPTAKALLFLNAVASGASIAADIVKIERAFGNNSTADGTDRVLVLANTGVHLAGIALALAKSVLQLANQAILRAFADTFLTLGAAVTAAAVILDVAALYHDTGGNISRMWQELVAPAAIGGLARLPSLVAGVVSGVTDILYLTGAIATKGGPIGIAASLFVLAGLLVANKEKVASAIYGTMPFSAIHQLAGDMPDVVGVAFTGAAAANSLDAARAVQAERAASLRGAAAWLSSLTAGDADGAMAAGALAAERSALALHVGALLDAAGRLRFAARALVEESDDFASAPFDTEPERLTEGYLALHTLSGTFNFTGEVAVTSTIDGGEPFALSRSWWRALLDIVNQTLLPAFTYGWTVTDTNAIAESEYTRWAGRLSAAGNEFTLWAAEYQIEANAVAGP